jgi:hypothetical protein
MRDVHDGIADPELVRLPCPCRTCGGELADTTKEVFWHSPPEKILERPTGPQPGVDLVCRGRIV